MEESINNFMEGVSPEDYCEFCGTPLHEMITLPDGIKRNVAHETNGKECKEAQRSNQAYENSCFDVDRRESELAEMEGGDLY